MRPEHAIKVAVATLVLSSIGCNGSLYGQGRSGAKVQIRVDGLASSTARRSGSFYIMPGLPNVEPEELQFREFKAQAELALAHEGFVSSLEAPAADLGIFLSYGIGEPQLHYETISYPVFGLVSDGRYSVNTQTQSFGGTTHTTSTVQDGQRMAVTGYQTRTRTKVKYDRFLTLSAVDLAYYRSTGKIDEVWRTTVTSTGSSDDLRRIFPVMMAAAMRRFAVTTPGKVDVDITEQHPRARYLRREITLTELRALESSSKPH